MAGPIIDWGVNTGKEVVDMGEDIWRGGGQVVDDVSKGNWGDAAGHAVDTVGEVASDAVDVVADTVGNTIEARAGCGRGWREHGQGVGSTIGSWF